MKKIILLASILFSLSARAQREINQRIILIGDAGELDKQQSGVLTDAASKILKNKTTVLYLGDNIYPTGMGLPGSKEEDATKKILQMQYLPMRKGGAPVFFIPGNHDWDRMGPKGLAKVKREWEYINEQKDSLLKVVPPNGCPDPTEIKVSENVTIIAFDSEWWLHVYNKDNPDADCNCKTNDEIISRMDELLYKNRNKIILLADHHPFITYGHHGGVYIWQDYIFPLTSVQQNLYIPLPVIGALYPILRKYFANPEDNLHPLYKNMIRKITGVFEKDPNVVYVSGHEHGLQFIKNKHDLIQVVSGSGAKQAVVKKGEYALYAQSIGGYVTVDIMDDKSMNFTYYASATDSNFKSVFTYTKPYVKVTIPVLKSDTVIKGDSITVMANPSFNKVSKIHRLAYGENYRKEWAAPARVPIIRIAQIKGGLTPVQFGGAHQTNSLLLKDASGKGYILSSIEKYPEFVLPQAMRQTFDKAWLQDAMSSQYPYGAVVASVLAKAVKVVHTDPIIGWVAPDHRLGYYEKTFANRLCLLEERELGDTSINTGNMLRQLDSNYNNRVDTNEFFRARMLDWFLGDWDQHEDQWRWIYTWRGPYKYFSAIPHERTEIFYTNEGIIPKIASRQFVARFLKGYYAGSKTINDFFYNDHTLNARLISRISYEEWMRITRNFAAALSDDVLEASLRKLPLGVYKISHERLLKAMKQRRDQLIVAADIYYKFFNKVVDIKATDKSELVTVKDTLNRGIVVKVFKLPTKGPQSELYSKVFDPAITREVRVYAAKGNDSITIDKKISDIKVRVIGGVGNKIYNIKSGDRRVDIYDKVKSANFIGSDQSIVDKHISNDTSNVSYVPTNLYNTIIPLFSMGYNVDDGFYLDGGIRYLHQGFRKLPSSTQQFTYGHSFASEANRINYKGDWVNVFNTADAEISIKYYIPNSINFFGRGNGTGFNTAEKYSDYYRVKFNYLNADATVRFQNLAGTVSLRIGPSVQFYRLINDDQKRLINQPSLIDSYDSTSVGQNKLHVGMVANYIDDKRDNPILPNWGVYVNARLQGYAGLGTYSKSYFQAIPEAILYMSVDAASTLVISERVGGGITWGKTAFYQSMFLGGQDNLIGYKQFRFAGQHMLYNNLEARIRLNSLLEYISTGQFGITARYDIGRVWEKQQPYNAWHNGFGAGMYFSPSGMALLQLKAAYSVEGWYPEVNFKLTF